MSIQRFFLTPITILTLLVGLITIISLGGCPVQQQPRTSETQADDATQRQPTENNQRGTRPIPPPVIDDDETGVGDLGTGGGTGGGATGGIFDPDEGTTSQPVSVIVSAPDASDINILPGGDGLITYEVFGGDPADGVVTVQLFYDVDGVADTGDEIVLESNLAPRGTEAFQALGITPGAYRIGIKASNNKEIVSAYATGRLVIVGVPLLTFNEPATDVRVRPGATVSVQFQIESLAATMSYSVFTDTDTEINGNEIEAFTGGGLSGTGTIFLDNFDAGTYFIGVTVTDSVGQEKTEYFGVELGAARRITVDLAPSVQVTEPTSNVVVPPGGQAQVGITVIASDAEAAATVNVFRDVDGVFNRNEAILATFEMTSAQQTFVLPAFDTSGLALGTYKLGASIDDGIGDPIAAYAPGSIQINAAPTGTVLTPSTAIAVRPGTSVSVNFQVEDNENALQPQPDGVQVVLFEADANGAPRDLNGDGVIDDNDLVHQESDPSFGLGQNSHSFDTSVTAGLLNADGNGEFVVGVRIEDQVGNIAFAFAPGLLAVDSVVPQIQLTSPAFSAPELTLTLDKIDSLTVRLQITDTSPVAFGVLLDPDLELGNGGEFVLVVPTLWSPGDPDPEFTFDPLTGFEAGLFHVQLIVQDAVTPFEAHYSPRGANQSNPNVLYKIRIRDRLIGTIATEDLADPGFEGGAILHGHNFNDLAGSTFMGVPDLTGDENNEFLIVARFGKSFIFNNDGIGVGEAYMVYSDASGPNRRLTGAQTLNAVGRGSIPGVPFTGIRMPVDTKWSAGMSDAVIVPDMDGDDLPELVFSFPRVESVSLAAGAPVQHPELFPDISGMGSLEYNALGQNGWVPNTAQFTRGGIVIVSSHNEMLKRAELRNRKFDRVIDLHEVGQLFNSHFPPSLVPYIFAQIPKVPPTFCADCEENIYTGDPPECTEGCGDCGGEPLNEAESLIFDWSTVWDTVFNNQGPGGFHQPWTATPADPPLASPRPFTVNPNIFYPPPLDPCSTVVDRVGCMWENFFLSWNCPVAPFPCTTEFCLAAWEINGVTVWTGFYGPNSSPFIDPASGFPSTVGARMLGQSVDDQFGSAIGTNGTWLYISAPEHTALQVDVPALRNNRSRSGVVYQYRVDTRVDPTRPTRSQLWIEPGQAWPSPDAELTRLDYTMPVPHQYIIETVGSTRGNSGDANNNYDYAGDGCLPPWAATGGAQAIVASSCYSANYVAGTSGFYADRTPQIVGPGVNAKLTHIRGIADMNDDGIRDFVTGSQFVLNANGERVGAVYIVLARQPGLEGDILLERMAFRPNDPLRQNGVMLIGVPGQIISRAFDDAGDFNGDGVADVIVGSENGAGGNGEAIVVLGSRTLLSPEDGYTFDGIVGDQRAIRFTGAAAGDLAGANVAAAGDVDGDGFGDILIAAPNALSPITGERTGVVYLIYGSSTYVGGNELDLAQVGTPALKGVVFVGRRDGDMIGGGTKVLTGIDPAGNSITAFSRGVSGLGDIDGDGRDDYAISAMLADPFGKTDAGEVYVIYGRGDMLGQP
ncbi:MAG: FG-GAP repeat protein [Planctomycetes bacterium]|nr:FG-GAP repeat protein [Planctomycetota bacterium]